MSSFDVNELEGLKPDELDIGFIIEDGDPDPNTVTKLAVATRDRDLEALLGADGVWRIEGQELGPDLQRILAAALAFAPELGDLRESQGPDAFAQQRRELGPQGFIEID